MRKTPIIGIILLIPAFMLFSLAGCTKSGDKTTPAAETKKSDNDTPKVVEKKKIDKPTDGVLKGFVKFAGDPPAPEIDERIAKHASNGLQCMAGKDKDMINVEKQMWIVGKDKGVANVVISLEPPADKKYDVTDKLKEPFKTPKLIDQPFCTYIPHVTAVLADVQPIIFKNSAQVTHNVTIQTNPPKVHNMPPDDSTKPETLAKSKAPVEISCSAHNWMSGKILVFEHPYFDVTKRDGSFEIKNVPIDTELTVYMWHESKPAKWEAKKITLKKGDNELPLEISGK